MKIEKVILMSSLLMFSVTAFAQDIPKFEVFGDYSYMQFNPTVTGLQSRAFNGGGGGVQFNFGRFVAIKGDFQGYGSTEWTVTETEPHPTPHGTVPAGTFTSSGNMFTYLLGPVVGVHTKRVHAYGELLLGGSNSNGYAHLTDAINSAGGTISVSGTQHPFTMALGGGLDVNVGKHVALRLGEFDWILTRYTNPLTDTNNQHSFRYLAGIVFGFGQQ